MDLLLGWGPVAAVVLAGVTWISSSGVIAKVLGDLGPLTARSTERAAAWIARSRARALSVPRPTESPTREESPKAIQANGPVGPV